jgi:hypothetical protein
VKQSAIRRRFPAPADCRALARGEAAKREPSAAGKRTGAELHRGIRTGRYAADPVLQQARCRWQIQVRA